MDDDGNAKRISGGLFNFGIDDGNNYTGNKP
jgi:hypothetical protein